MVRQPVDVEVESAGLWHVLVDLHARIVVEAGGVAYYLRDLPTAYEVVRPEVWPIQRITRLRCARLWVHLSAWEATHISTGRQPLDEEPENAAMHIIMHNISKCLLLIGNEVREAGSVDNELGELSTGYVVVGAERVVTVPPDDTSTREAPDVGVEGVLFIHV